jgi:hypothetical protein
MGYTFFWIAFLMLLQAVAFDGVRFYNQYCNYSSNRAFLPLGNANFSE